MPMNIDAAARTLEIGRRLGLLSDAEVQELRASLEPSYLFTAAVQLADTMHAHVKVENVMKLPHDELRAAGGVVENEKEGYVKYAFPGGMNLIFSSINVSQDDLRGGTSRRARPFLDHFGIDLRQETDSVRTAFDAAPAQAMERGWGHVPQGGEGRPVYCCHVTVSRKHWVYPPAHDGKGQIPVEFAFGPLTVHPDKSGCDLRPADPRSAAPTASACEASAAPSGKTSSSPCS